VQRGVADEQAGIASAPSGRISACGTSTLTSATEVAEALVTATLWTAGSGSCVISCTDSTAPSLPTQSEGSRT
jgi:hypothetical protein